MRISEIMTSNPTCCTPDTTLKDAARMMAECDCGEIPVCDSNDKGHVIGVITDRDITCRAVAQGLDVNKTPVSKCMTTPVISSSPNASLEDVMELMEENMIRRIPVIDDRGCVCGMLSQADIACKTDGLRVTEIVREISQPTDEASRVGSASMR